MATWVQGEADLISGWTAASVLCAIYPDTWSWHLRLSPAALQSCIFLTHLASCFLELWNLANASGEASDSYLDF